MSPLGLLLTCLTAAVFLPSPCCWALRDVVLQMPPVARVGGSVTLRCLYDLEDDKLYAVKWYRGNFEFYRSTPHESPPKQAFDYPDFHVDLAMSDEHQVTLRRLPLHMSGTFACEVSTDAPAFTTFIKSGQLLVLDTVRRPLLTVSKNVYLAGDELEANCTSAPDADAEVEALPLPPPLGSGPSGRPAGRLRGHRLHMQPQPLLPQPPPLQPHQLTPEQRAHLQMDTDGQPAMTFGFWVNNKQVPSGMVEQRGPSATLRRRLSETDFASTGELRLKCVVTLADKYRESSHVVTVRRQDAALNGVEEPPAVVTDVPSLAVNPAELPEPADRTSTAGASVFKSSVTGIVVILLSSVALMAQGNPLI